MGSKSDNLNYRTYVTDESGELLPEGKVRLESGKIVESQVEEPYFDGIDTEEAGKEANSRNELIKNIRNNKSNDSYQSDDGTTMVKTEEYWKDIIEDDKEKEEGTIADNDNTDIPTNQEDITIDRFAQVGELDSGTLDDAVASVNSMSPELNSYRVTPEPFKAITNEASMILHMQSLANNVAKGQMMDAQKASASDKWGGFKAGFNNTMAGGVFDYFKYDRAILREYSQTPEDSEWQDNFGTEEVNNILKTYNLDDSSFTIIKDAKSLDHAIDLARMEKDKQEATRKVNSTLTEREQFWYGLTAEVVSDPTTWILPVAYTGVKMATKAGRMTDYGNKMVAGWSAGLDIGYGATVGATSDDMNMAEALMIYGAISVLDYKLIRSLSKEDTYGTSLVMQNGFNKSEMIDEYPIFYGRNISDKSYIDVDIIRQEAKQIGQDIIDVEVATEKGLPLPSKYKELKEIQKQSDIIDVEISNIKKESATLEGIIATAKEKIVSLINESKTIANGGLEASKINSKIASAKRQITNNLKKQTALDNKLKKLSVDSISKKAQLTGRKLTPKQQMALKAEIESRINISSNIGFRRLSNIADDLVSNAKSGIHINSEHLRLINESISDVKNIAQKIEMEIASVKKSVEVHGKTDPKLASDILNVYRAIAKEGHISKSAMAQIESSYNKGLTGGFKKPTIKIEPTKDGKGAKLKINNKIVGTVGISALAVSSAEASNSGDVGLGIGVGLLAMLLGVKVVGKFKSASGKTIGEKVSSIYKSMQNSDNTRSMRSRMGAAANESRTTISETIEPMYRNVKDPVVVDFIKKFYFNPLDADGSVVETIKRQLKEQWTTGLRSKVNPLYRDWLKEGNVSNYEEISGLFQSMTKQMEFNKKVFENIHFGKHSESNAVVEASKVYKRLYDEVTNTMVGTGVKASEKMQKIKNYVPRVLDRVGFSEKMSNITADSYDKIVKAFASTLTQTKNAEDVARVYLDSILDTSLSAKTFSRNARDDLTKVLKSKGLSDEAIDEIIEITSGQYGRTKSRLHMDYSKFGKVKINYADGSTAHIGYDDIFMTDMISISDTLFNTAAGHIAFAHKEFKSVDDVLSLVIDSKIDPSYARTLINDIQATVGVPTIDYSSTANVVFKNIGNAAIGGGMVLSTISLMSEGVIALANTIRSSGVYTAMKSISRSTRSSFGDDSFVVQSIKNGENNFGYGMNRETRTFGQFKTFDEAGNIDTGLEGMSKWTEMWRDFTLHTLPFSRTTDFLERWNFQNALDTLKMHFDKKFTFKDYELSAFGIDKVSPELLKKIKSHMSLNSKGHVKFFDYTKWSIDEQIEFKQLMDRMMMKRMNKTTMGTSAAYSRHAGIGAALMPMLKFPMSAYSNIGAFLGRGVLQGDPFAMTLTMLWFQAGMVQAQIRNEINGKDDMEADELIYSGLMNMPTAGVYGLLTGLTHSPTTKTMEQYGGVFDLYNYVGNK